MLMYTVTLKDLKEGIKPFRDTAERMKKPAKMLREIGMYMLGSIDKNFNTGGRPVRWKVSHRAAGQGRAGSGRTGQTLLDTARLKNSITMRVSGKILKLGTNLKYAATHHYGRNFDQNVTVRKHWRKITQAFGKPVSKTVGVRAHSRHMKYKIPARPFVLIQDPGDWRVIHRISEDYLLPGAGH